MFRYTYKITLLNGSFAGHYYLGQHSTDNLNDGYAGSGRLVNDYYKKYGKIEHQTYIKEIIAFYNSGEELNQAEFDLIGDKYETDELCLNLRAGGNNALKRDYYDILSKKFKGRKNYWNIDTNKDPKHIEKCRQATTGKKRTEEQRKHISDGHKGQIPWNKGIPMTDKQKAINTKMFKGKHWKIDPETGKRKWY